MTKIDKQVLELIEEVKRTKAKVLNLQYFHLQKPLTSIPEAVFKLDWLEELDLSGNRIEIIPDDIEKLTNLKELNLLGNPIQQLPDISRLCINYSAFERCKPSLGNVRGLYIEKAVDKWPEVIDSLPNLSYLSFEPRKKSILPKDISHLSQLEVLNVSSTGLTEFPTGIENLSRLRTLYIRSNPLHELPSVISKLTNLEMLDISELGLRELPQSFEKLKKLELLLCFNSQFNEFPQALFGLDSLISLYLHNNSKSGAIKSIPRDILKLKHLKVIDVGGHPIETPPPEVVKQGVEAIKNYYRQLDDGDELLCEAKLIIVGEGGAGKTSLAKKLQNENYQLTERETSTEGIDVIEWHFDGEVIKQGEEQEEIRDIQVNTWDFGGQEIYHTTHQFFLTKRSVYVLVADNRKEDTDFNYWLNVVELLSDGSPVLIVKNEKQDRVRPINEQVLKKRYGNLVEVLATNLDTNRGLREVKAAIEQQILKLPHMGTRLPATWKKVREALERDKRDYISLDDYLSLCDEHGFRNEADKLQLSGYLHDLGICLHFQDDDVLKQTVILNPTWGTDAVYRVLDDKLVINQHGRFDKHDLAKIWHEDKYANMHDALLQLMIKFKLCYAIEGQNRYIAPQLLELEQPDYEWNYDDNLVVKYRYEFMPKGIITRFIVAMHELIVEQDWVWRDGVVIEVKGTKALAIEDYNKKEITLRIRGENRKALFQVTNMGFHHIHDSYPKLDFDKHFPCICDVCKASKEPNLYPYKVLSRFADDNKAIQCQVSYEMVNAAEVISNTSFTSEFNFFRAFNDGKELERNISFKLMSAESTLTSMSYRDIFRLLTSSPISFDNGRMRVVSAEEKPKPEPPKVSNYQLTKLIINNVRSIGKLDIDFSEAESTRLWSVILGDNAAGKTTILRSIALGLCREGEAMALLEELEGDFIKKGEDEAHIFIKLKDVNDHTQPIEISTKVTKVDGIEVLRQTTLPEKHFPWSDIFVCGYGVHRAHKADKPIEGHETGEAVRSLFDYKTPLYNPETVLLRQSRTERSFLEKKLIQVLMLNGEKDSFNYDKTGLKLTSHWGVQPVTTLSDGYRSTLTWVADFLSHLILAEKFKDPSEIGGILLLDEIEQHLHPRWQRFIVQRLRQQFPKTQIIATTHTPLVAQGIADVDSAALVKLTQGADGQFASQVIGKDEVEGKRADQVLVEVFGLLTTRNSASEDKIDRYSELLGKTNRTAKEQQEFAVLCKGLKAALSPAENQLQKDIDQKVSEDLQRRLQNVSPDDLDAQTKAELRALFDLED